MKNFLSKNNFLIFFLLILGISIMNVMKIVKIGLMASISSNLIHSDWCELCFSDYKEINPPESNLAEEAQKIKESKNKTENNGDENIEKININGTKDKSKTSARKAKTKENCNTSECGIIPENIKMDNRILANDYDIIHAGDTIKDTENNSLKAETEIESPYPNDFNYNSNIGRNYLNSSLKDINTNTREGINTNTRKYSPNNKEDFFNNTASNIDENSIINTYENPMINNEGIAATNSNKGIAATNSNKEVDETNSKVDEDYFRPETLDDKE